LCTLGLVVLLLPLPLLLLDAVALVAMLAGSSGQGSGGGICCTRGGVGGKGCCVHFSGTADDDGSNRPIK
jgi:hypothetical protein